MQTRLRFHKPAAACTFVLVAVVAALAQHVRGQSSTTRCGTDWSNANSFCNPPCKSNGDCPDGMSCFADLAASCTTPTTSAPSALPTPATPFAYRPFKTAGVIGYWPNWAPYSRPQNAIDKLNLDGVSIVVYSFLNLLADGSIKSSDSFQDSTYIPTMNKQVRDKYPNLLTSIAVGGWSLSRYFSIVAANETLTRTFAKNIHAYMDSNGFDGLDIDYEYPGGGAPCNAVNPNDVTNMVRFFKILREELGPDRLISFAISVTTDRYVSGGVNYLSEYAKYLSYIGLMSYDMYTTSLTAPYSDVHSALFLPGPSDPQRPAANTPLASTAMGVESMLSAGVTPSQIVIGVPFYGHSWSVVAQGDSNGVFQACAKPGQNPANATACPVRPGDYLDAVPTCDFCDPTSCSHTGVWFYFNMRANAGTQRNAPLAAKPLEAGNGWTREFVRWAQSPTLYNPAFLPTDSTGKNVTAEPYPAYISYDDQQSIYVKSLWAKLHGLAGVMVWELSQDYQEELLSAMKAGWTGSAPPGDVPNLEDWFDY
ncbi:glycoside hydrolase superfamily [Zopfochytrium polystomum]|nr:glycoside hydrolase superfamily [Zopfochytrium polystomum]